MKKKHVQSNPGILFIMLGIGFILAFAFPAKFLVIFLSIVLILSGIALCKC